MSQKPHFNVAFKGANSRTVADLQTHKHIILCLNDIYIPSGAGLEFELSEIERWYIGAIPVEAKVEDGAGIGELGFELRQ